MDFLKIIFKRIGMSLPLDSISICICEHLPFGNEWTNPEADTHLGTVTFGTISSVVNSTTEVNLIYQAEFS